MFDFDTAIGYVYLRAVPAPICGGFRGIRKMALQAVGGWFGGMILMQEKVLRARKDTFNRQLTVYRHFYV